MMSKTYDIFLFAGEQSGDIQGEMLLKSLFLARPSLKMAGVLGPKMRTFDIDEILPMEEFNIMGFGEVIKSFKKIWKHFFYLKSTILKLNPKAVIFIDYPGFNLKMAAALRKSGFKGKLIQHVCPSVWAWKKSRIGKMEETLNLLLCLFPFEPKCFDSKSIKTCFIGHPLVNTIKSHTYKNFAKKEIISIFPGSRDKEIFRNLPLQLKTCAQCIKNSHEIVISCVHPKYEHFIKDQINLYPDIQASIIPSYRNYDIMKASKLSIATSGTVTLELALHKIPTLVTYFISSFDFFLARKIFKIDLPHYCIVNYLANRRIFPEFYGPHFNEKKLIESFNFMLNNPEEEKIVKNNLSSVSHLLYNKTIIQDCAKIILETVFQT